MRIGVVTTSYPRTDGDPAGAFVAAHARALAALGHEVEVIAAGDPASDAGAVSHVRAGTLFSGGGAPEVLDRGGLRPWLSGARFGAELAARVARRARRWDAIVAHWLLPSALVARLAGPRRPLLAIAHSGDVHWARRLGLVPALARLFAAPHVQLSFVSRALREDFLNAVPAVTRARLTTQVCAMGIDVARFRQARVAAGPARFDRPPMVVFLGRLVPVKGAELFVDAAARVRRPARFVLAGDGPERAALAERARAGGRVELVGEVCGEARDRLLAAADLVVLPSRVLPGGRTEGLPQVALEAMAAGAAVVAARVGGLAELPPGCVRWCPVDDAVALADAIEQLVADPARRIAQVVVAERAVARFDWAELGPRLVPARSAVPEPALKTA